MQPAFTALFMLLFVLLCLLGILANGFIVLVLSREWRRLGRLLPSDMILISLGASRFCLQWVGMVHNFYAFFHLEEFNKGLAGQLVRLQWDFLNSATFWFGTWLSVLFCMKIANLTHPTFLWLKWRFPGSVPWLLLGSLLTSTIVTLFFFWGDYTLNQGFFIREVYDNMTYMERVMSMEIHYFLPLKFVLFSIPCSVFLVSTALLIHSLRRHARTMRQSAHSLQDASTQAHTRALKSLIFFLILYILSFMSPIIDTVGFFSSENDWFWPWQIVTYLCTSVHPFIHLLSSPRLRAVFRQLLLLARGFWLV
ncbi:PREDICTED: taste receptor type 2 member 41 [Myotis davidii]|uniref:Taste receptor type 2 n=1 Tax=Myotis davidii TaxID=225400 RepID=L5LLV2_MYODS|nr:PREDICTED: taste receptor type 2 member 41 [Myotis davidii]ELK27007.1 Taste receptor type 2 member 41 [Myotis davidii]